MSAKRAGEKADRNPPYAARMRAMLVIWSTILVTGLVYFTIIGLTHH
jgi:hypothetical protein